MHILVHLFPPDPFPLKYVSLLHASMSGSILFVSVCCSLGPTCAWDPVVRVFLWSAYFPQHPALQVPLGKNNRADMLKGRMSQRTPSSRTLGAVCTRQRLYLLLLPMAFLGNPCFPLPQLWLWSLTGLVTRGRARHPGTRTNPNELQPVSAAGALQAPWVRRPEY